jgi:phage regulator Rha-like protein
MLEKKKAGRSREGCMKSVVPSFLSNLEMKRNKPMVSSVSIAVMFERRHDKVLEAIRTKLIDGLHLPVFGEMSSDERGRERPIYWLDERSALIAMPFIGGKKSIEGQQKLVDAYLAYRRGFAQPPRNTVIRQKRDAHKLMTNALAEIREEAGKNTRAHHFIVENLLCNEIALGIRSAIDERTLSNEDAEVLRLIRERNSALLVAGVAYAERKARLRLYLDRLKAKALMSADRAAGNGPTGEGNEQGNFGIENSTGEARHA